MEPIFVDKNIQAYQGPNLKNLIREKNPQKFLDGKNIKKISQERWLEAQEYERKTWCDSAGKVMSSDRNEYHRQQFGGYSQLNFHLDKENLKMIELGCGPFTNIRLIIPEIFKSISKIDLLDPLIKDYILHTNNCTYKSGYISARKVNLIPTAIEDFESTEIYDVVIMINVLEHCKDIDLIFKKIENMMGDDSIFIFNDRSLKDSIVDYFVENIWDAGHPIILSNSYMEDIIKRFKILFRKENIIEEGDRTDHYLILKKK